MTIGMLLCVLICIPAIFFVYLGIADIVSGNLGVGFYLLVCLIAIVLSIITFKIFHKIKDKKQIIKYRKKRELEVQYENHVKELINVEFDFGEFGIVKKDKIDFDFMPRLSNDINDEKSIKHSINAYKKWAERVSKNKNYLVNHFMYDIINNVIELDIKFWENYRKNDKMTNEDCEKAFGKLDLNKIELEVKPYLEKETDLKINDIFDKYFKYFNYKEFVEGLDVGVSLSEENHLCVIIKDKLKCVIDVFEEFNTNLKSIEYHNDVDRSIIVIKKK